MLNDILAIHFPYCLRKRNDKLWVILNRNYKPVGSCDEKYIDYNTLPANLCIKNITSARAKRLSYSGESDRNAIYLYNDDCVPTSSKKAMDAYLARVAVLILLKNHHEN